MHTSSEYSSCFFAQGRDRERARVACSRLLVGMCTLSRRLWVLSPSVGFAVSLT